MANSSTSNHNLTKADDGSTSHAQFLIDYGNNLDKIDEMPVIVRQTGEPTSKIADKTLWVDNDDEQLKLWTGVAWEILSDWGNVVELSGNQTVGGIKTFSSFPVTPSSAPTSDYQVANKKYVDDNGGGGALNDLSDVTISSVADNHILRYNNSNSRFENEILNDDQIRKITISTSSPSGGSDGDIWIKYST